MKRTGIIRVGLVVGALATGKAVQQDRRLFGRLRRQVRTTLGVEMEGAAIGEVAARFKKQAIVIKAVSDHADEDKDDSFRTFAPDELIISTHPVGRSNWLERDVVGKARERFALPVTHVVVDLDAAQAPATASQNGASTAATSI